MNYLKYTPFIYLIAAGFFVYDGVDKYNSGEGNYWLSLLIAGLAIFMFIFRRHFAQKFTDRNKNAEPPKDNISRKL